MNSIYTEIGTILYSYLDAEKKFKEKFGFVGCVYSTLDVY